MNTVSKFTMYSIKLSHRLKLAAVSLRSQLVVSAAVHGVGIIVCVY
jgi:hypothetical protein